MQRAPHAFVQHVGMPCLHLLCPVFFLSHHLQLYLHALSGCFLGRANIGKRSIKTAPSSPRLFIMSCSMLTHPNTGRRGRTK